jgi:hypothetical protein
LFLSEILLTVYYPGMSAITCRIVSVTFFRQNNVTMVLGCSLGYPAKAVISIAEFGISVKVEKRKTRCVMQRVYF